MFQHHQDQTTPDRKRRLHEGSPALLQQHVFDRASGSQDSIRHEQPELCRQRLRQEEENRKLVYMLSRPMRCRISVGILRKNRRLALFDEIRGYRGRE